MLGFISLSCKDDPTLDFKKMIISLVCSSESSGHQDG